MVLYPHLVLYFSTDTVIPTLIRHSTQRCYVALLRKEAAHPKRGTGWALRRVEIAFRFLINKRVCIVVFEFLQW
jgi:hypothetical protein